MRLAVAVMMSECFAVSILATHMNERGSDENTGTKMLAEEENLGRNFHPLDLLGDDRKATAAYRCNEDNDFAVLARGEEKRR